VKRLSFIHALALLALVSACRSQAKTAQETAPSDPAPPPALASAPARPRIVVLGDSLTAGLGLTPTQSYPYLLQQKLNDEGYKFDVVNAGVSGDTSAGGVRRLDWALEGDVRVLIVALGGNDGLRGLSVDEMKRNIDQIIAHAREKNIAVVLAGMEAPPNFGPEYTAAFRAVFPALAKQYHVTLVPFLLAGVAGNDALNQRDGIHPTAQGARIVADNVWSTLKPILEQQQQTRKEGPAGS